MVSIKHTFVNVIPDDPTAAAAGQTLPSHWNAEHTIVGLDNLPSGSGTKLTGNSYLADPSLMGNGDSQMSQNDALSYQVSGSTTVALTRNKRTLGWMLDGFNGCAINYDTCYDPGDNYRHGSNAGVGGSSIEEARVRFNTGNYYTGFQPLSARPEKYVLVEILTNDINAGGTALGSPGYLPQIKISYAAYLNDIIAAGKTPIVNLCLPRNSTDGAFDWGAAGGTTTAQKRLTFNAANKWLKWYCRENNILVGDGVQTFSDATGQAKTGYTVEGLHKNFRGSYYDAQAKMNDYGFLFPKSKVGQQNAYDVYDATYNPNGNILNGALSGTAGVFSQGTGTGVLSGTVASNFQFSKNTLTSTDIACSLVTRADGLLWQQFDITSYGTGASSEDFRYNYWSGATTGYASFANYGDHMAAECIFEVEGGHNGIIRATQMRNGVNNGLTIAARTTISFDATTNRILDSANGFASFTYVNTPASSIYYPTATNFPLVVNVAGSTSNNRCYRIIAVDPAGGWAQVDPKWQQNTVLTNGNVTTEAAGASITIRMPAASVATNSSSELWPDEDTGPYYERCPTFIVPNTVTISPRAGFYLNGLIAGKARLWLTCPAVYKLPFRPSVLNYTATDL